MTFPMRSPPLLDRVHPLTRIDVRNVQEFCALYAQNGGCPRVRSCSQQYEVNTPWHGSHLTVKFSVVSSSCNGYLLYVHCSSEKVLIHVYMYMYVTENQEGINSVNNTSR